MGNVESRYTAQQAFQHQWVQQLDGNAASDLLNKDMLGNIHRFLAHNRLKKLALHIIARQVNDEAIEQLRNIFMSIDKDNSGTLTVDEMEEAVCQLGVGQMEQAGMIKVMRALDPSGSGSVEYTEFLAATMKRDQYLKEDVCKSAFIRLDIDGDGIISRRDLSKLLDDQDLLRSCGLAGRTFSELVNFLEHIMKEVDGNNDGGVSFAEFMELMAGEGSLLEVDSAVHKRKRKASKYGPGLQELSLTGGDECDLDASDDDEPGPS